MHKRTELWPTMVTPFEVDKKLDLNALEVLIDWYIAYAKVDGLFAVCQSSEMFFLTLNERVQLASRTVEYSRGRVPVIASGITSDIPAKQVDEVLAIAETGVESVILLTNQFAQQSDSDDIWQENISRFLEIVDPSIQLGLYECPYPYKRLLNPKLIAWCAQQGRFFYYKDTSCNTTEITQKVEAAAGSSLKIYNANTASLLGSLQAGCSGYCGVMTVFQPKLYRWLVSHFQEHSYYAQYIQNYMGLVSVLEQQLYPMNAKYILAKYGIPMTWECRKNSTNELTSDMQQVLDQFMTYDASVTEDFFNRIICDVQLHTGL